jgi:tRNA(Ile)-lysidine synthase TilS/MesJ
MKTEPRASVIHCTNCSLPDTFPGIRFNDKGVCNFCQDHKDPGIQQKEKTVHKEKFLALVKEFKGRFDYDAVMCYSGGKDSTYTLAVLKEEFNLNVLALSFDNGFLPDQTLENITNVVEKLGVDHLIIKPRFDVLAKIFSYCANNDVFPLKALERSSAICTSCMGIIKYSALRVAVEKEVPFIAYGWSPGQAPISSSVMKNLPLMVKRMQAALFDPLYKIIGDEIKPYFLKDKHFGDPYHLPYNIHPLAFLDYDIDAIYKNIARFGWKKPEEVDANSTNCLLNSFANYIHKKKLKFHPYDAELANLVRDGLLDRDEALQRIQTEESPLIVNMVKEKIERGKALSSD